MHVRVHMGGEHYALPVDDVREITPVGELTPLPGATRPFIGVRNLRGEVLPVIDLADLLGVQGAGEPQRLVVAQAGTLRAGLAVESVIGVSDIPLPDTPTDSPALRGAALVDGALVGVVDVAHALNGLVAL